MRIIPNVRNPSFPVYIYILYYKIRNNRINILVEIREVLRCKIRNNRINILVEIREVLRSICVSLCNRINILVEIREIE
jgi:hypothetical protein